MTSSSPEAVDADVVGSADGGNPGACLDELKVLGAVEIEDQRQRNQEAEERGDVGPPFHRARIRRRNGEQAPEVRRAA
jgi:hypothetical protein